MHIHRCCHLKSGINPGKHWTLLMFTPVDLYAVLGGFVFMWHCRKSFAWVELLSFQETVWTAAGDSALIKSGHNVTAAIIESVVMSLCRDQSSCRWWRRDNGTQGGCRGKEEFYHRLSRRHLDRPHTFHTHLGFNKQRNSSWSLVSKQWSMCGSVPHVLQLPSSTLVWQPVHLRVAPQGAKIEEEVLFQSTEDQLHAI